MTSEIICTLTLNNSDMVMQNHRVHGVSVMPGVVFLELTMRILQQKGLCPQDYEMRRIRFLEPVVTGDNRDAAVRVTIRPPSAGEPGRVVVASRDSRSSGPFRPNMRATLVRQERPMAPPLPPAVRAASAQSVLDMGELYRRACAENIVHGPGMRCEGTLAVHNGALLAELKLEVDDDSPFLMHPAALDATTIAAFGQTPSAFDDPFIPVTIETFRFFRRLSNPFRMFAPRKEVLSDTADVISNSYQLFNADGEPCATFERLVCKRIRSPELVQRLLADGWSDMAAAEQMPSPAATTAAGSYRDLLMSWIGPMLGVDAERVATDLGFYSLGLDSGQLLSLSERLERELGLPVYPTLLFEHSDIDALSTCLERQHGPLGRHVARQTRPAAETADATGPEPATAFARVAWVDDARPCVLADTGGVTVSGLSARELEELRGRLGSGWRVETAPAPAKGDGVAHVLVVPADADERPDELLTWAVEEVKRIGGEGGARQIIFLADRLRAGAGIAGLAAYCRSVRMETPRLAVRVVQAAAPERSSALALELGKSAADLPPTAGLIRQVGADVQIQALVEDGADSPGREGLTGLGEGDVCVVSGGGGGLARHVCEWLRRSRGAQVILLGRNPSPPPWLGIAGRTEGQAAAEGIRYRCCDVTDEWAVNRILDEERHRSGPIRAVFHLAGVRHDAVHSDIAPEDIDRTLAPKLDGFRVLDHATSGDPLSLFVVFSSLAAWRPNPGQAVYAFANAALEHRAAERDSGPGRTVSVAWPLWRDGGMTMTQAQRARAAGMTGLVPLPAADGLDALAAAVSAPHSRLAVLYGDPGRYRRWLSRSGPDAPAPEPVPVPAVAGDGVDIAIVGLAGRFPDAEDIQSFWEHLCRGHDAIREIPVERWDHAAIFDSDRNAPGKTYSRWGGFLEGIDVFDAEMFNVSRKEAERMDPQERLFLENAWTLLEEAGHPARTVKGRPIGVYVGVMWNHYQLQGTGTEVAPNALHAAIANRVSYAFDLTGPSMAVDSACSSSLTALGLALDALRLGHCQMAIAGGVNLAVHPEKYRQLALGQFLSDDGRCRSFGEGGSGYVPGEGVGAVLLRPLRDAIEDGDHVWAVIRGCSLRHGGRTGGVTVPSPAAQAAVIRQAWDEAGITADTISADTISYVEAHGTGTALGDPIEIDGLVQALGEARGQPLAIGSVKSNIGHLESAAGIAAIAKVVLMMRERQLVPSLHADPPNPKLALDGTGLRVVRSLSPWRTTGGGRLRAGISSFGAGGSNAHLVLEEYPAHLPPRPGTGPGLIVLSAPDTDTLRDYCARMADAVAALSGAASGAAATGSTAAWLAETLGIPAGEIDGNDTLAALGMTRADIQSLQRLTGADIGLDTRVRDLPGMGADPATAGEGHLLDAIAHHLQRHRTHLPARLAFVADSLADVVSILKGFAGGGPAPSCEGPAPLEEAGRRWLDGGTPDFSSLWPGPPPSRISLPVPKLGRRNRFWLGRWKSGKGEEPPMPRPAPAAGAPCGPAVTERDKAGETVMHDIGETVSLTVLDGGVAVVAMNDADHHNMFTAELLSALERAFAAIESDSGIGAAVLTGTSRVFSLGGTPDTLEKLARKEVSFTSVPFLYQGLERCRVPVVAAIRGHAAGGGLTFGLHADVAILDRSGTYSANFIKFGFTPGLGATHVLEQSFGAGIAKEMCLTGREYSGRELEARGVSVRFADHDAVVETALHMARVIAGNGQAVVQTLKRDYGERAGAVMDRVIRRETEMHAAVLDETLVPQIRNRARTAPAPAVNGPAVSRAGGDAALTADAEQVKGRLLTALCRTLYLAPEEVDPGKSFAEMGLDSLGAVEIVRDLNAVYGTSFDSVLVYSFPTIDSLAQKIASGLQPVTITPGLQPVGAKALPLHDAVPAIDGGGDGVLPRPHAETVGKPSAPALLRSDMPRLTVRSGKSAQPARREGENPSGAPVRLAPVERRPSPAAADDGDDTERAIAIIGMSARYPGCETVEAFWDVLSNGRSTVGQDTAHRWNNADLFAGSPSTGHPDARWVGFIDGIDQFDPAFFGISPREAELMDPQQRVFLEQSWRAIEHAGYAVGPEKPLDCGIFVGSSSGDYLSLLHDRGAANSGQVFLGNSSSVLAARLAYFLNFRGPTIALDTACSSSLVAVHLACQAIRSGDCAMAIAGGVGLMVTPQMYLWNSRSGMLSARGRCASFDASADGFVLGEGVGMVVLKPLADAIRDRDGIHAVIRASGINGDGKTNGITAPSAEAQLALQRRVHARSGIGIDDIAYVETHGAGTQLGDPIEVKALNELAGARGAGVRPCGIGSVKSNIGHTTLAAGVAGLMKVVLALKHRTIPASLHFETLNDKIRFDPAKLRVVAQAEPWPPASNGRRAAAVNSFGVSGTNCHMVVCEAPDPSSTGPALTDEGVLLPVSAKTPAALAKNLRSLGSDIAAGIALEDAAFTLSVGRAAFRYRAAIVARSRDEALRMIDAASREGAAGLHAPSGVGAVPADRAWDARLTLAELAGLAKRFCDGDPVDFESFYALRPGRRVPLSGHALDNRRFWVPEGDDRAAAPVPPASAAPSRSLLEVVDPQTVWASDHQVGERRLVPGAAVLHWGFAGPDVSVLEDIAWPRTAEVFSRHEIYCHRQGDAAAKPVLDFVLDGGDAWARTTAGGPGEPPRRAVPDAEGELESRISGAELYRRFAAAGIHYGPSYRLVREIRCGADVAVAHLIPQTAPSIQLYDAILQCVGALTGGTALRVPRRIRRAVRSAHPIENTTVVRVRTTAPERFDLVACDQQGNVTLEIDAFELALMEPEAKRASAPPPSPTKPADIVTGAIRQPAAGAGETGGYIPQWTRYTPLPAGSVPEHWVRSVPEHWVHAWGDDPARILSGLDGVSDLILDFRQAPDEDPGAALETARHLFQTMSAASAGDVAVTLVTSGAAALDDRELLRPVQAALTAFTRAAVAEHAGWRFRSVDTVSAGHDLAGGTGLPPLHDARDGASLYRDGAWYQLTFSPQEPRPAAVPVFQDGSTYLIVGGAGGLGYTLSQTLARSHRVKIGWIGRRRPDPVIERQIADLARLGVPVHYVRADAADGAALLAAVREIRAVLGPISGVYHSALVLDDVPVATMSAGRLSAVLRPKIDGIRALHAATESEPISHFVVFSSVASFMRAPGQANYAAASAYVDAFAADLRRRYGTPTHVVNWGYWGGVGVVAQTRYAQAMAAIGVGSIGPEDGFAWLHQQLAEDVPQLMVIKADPHALSSFGLVLADRAEAPDASVQRAGPPVAGTRGQPWPSGGGVRLADVEAHVATVFARVLKMNPNDLDSSATFEAYGVDSLIAMDIVRDLGKDFGGLPATLLYERLTIAEVAAFLLAERGDEAERLLAPPAPAPALAALRQVREAAVPAVPVGVPASAVGPVVGMEEIAIVGMAGRYPGADDLDEFWDNLRAGRRSISQAPRERGDWRRFYHPDGGRGRTNNIHGGFIAGIDLFDARFFNILPSEAGRIDPQERLFLEVCWELLESAGRNGDKTRQPDTGVFVGCMYGGYGQMAAAQGWTHGRFDLGHSSSWSIANRISYHFDLNGPSMCVDTACSSSLTAFHLACESLRRGDCRQAIAGGVNLILHPSHHVALASMRMLGTGAACRTFDRSADGIVPGEGVGAVLLRPLADALADGDRILAVACGGAMNAGGKTGGYTVPNPSAQTAVIRRAIARSGLALDRIDGIEVHGTGTAMGDPLEITALRQVFEGNGRTHPLRVGSVKANIGHLEGAAGIAGLTKAILQLHHRAFAPCAGLETLNEKIDFGSAIRPVMALEPWDPPAEDGVRPRACGVSSFGAGGANVHVLLRECAEVPSADGGTADGPALFLLSAMDEAQLRRHAGQIAGYVRRTHGVSLARLCYTSQTGRRALPWRAALAATSLEGLVALLDDLAAGRPSDLCRVSGPGAVGKGVSGALADEIAGALIARGQLADAGAMWAAGADIGWNRFWRQPPGRCAYPTLPLNRVRHWLPDPGPENGGGRSGPTDDGDGRGWLAALSADHRIMERCLLPGAALLEIALGAAEEEGQEAILDFRWLRPLPVEAGRSPPPIEARETGNRWHLREPSEDEPLAVFRIGRAEVEDGAAPPSLPGPAPQGGLPHCLDGADFYARMKEGGFDYGPSLRIIRRVEWDGTRCIAWLNPGMDNRPGTTAAVLDAAMQTAALVSHHKAAVPAGVASVRRIRPAGTAVSVVTQARPSGHCDIRVLDEAGEAVIALSGFHTAAVTEAGFGAAAGVTYWQAADMDAPPAGVGLPLQAVLLDAGDAMVRGAVAAELAAQGIRAFQVGDEPDGGGALDGAILCVADGGGGPAERLAGHLHGLFRLVDVMRQRRHADHVRVVVASLASDAVTRSLAGATRSLHKENPWLTIVHAVLENWDLAPALVTECRLADMAAAEISLTPSRRTTRVLVPLQPSAAANVRLTAGALYLITGGAGGLGRIFAEHLSALAPVTIGLLGRRAPSAALDGWMADAAAKGGRIVYRQVDVCDDVALSRVIRDLAAEFGPVRGVVHAAGLTRDGLAKGRRREDIAAVLAPKVTGTLALDRCLAAENLDFFLLCSSLAAETGNVGQADYAAANRFMSGFAQARELRRRSGLCSGNTVAVAWPLWRDGGMAVDEATERRFAKHFGMRPLSTADGLAAFDLCLQGGHSSIALVDGVRTPQPAAEPAPPRPQDAARAGAGGLSADTLEPFITSTLRSIASGYLMVEPDHVEFDRPLIDVGFDSISLSDLVNRLNGALGLDLLPSVLFECPTLDDVARYLLSRHTAEVAAVAAERMGQAASCGTEPVAGTEPARTPEAFAAVPDGGRHPVPRNEDEPIAITGMAGRLAGADNLRRFWHMLIEGEEFLRGADDARSSLRDDPALVGLKAGFVNGADQFDAAAFGISPREAERMDPQQRLFIEAAYEAMQDAGHAPASVRGRVIGVFAGVSTSDYGSLMTEAGLPADPHVATGVSHAILANRVSHVFDWTGPSEVIDTACSSSLVALHHAVAALRRGECDMACVGGVNLTLSAGLFHAFAQSGMLSRDHRCKTFAADADGYVRGEGVGVVILRPLSAALRDRDQVYAVIRGSAVNHVGKSTSLTAPNPAAQATVIRKAIESAGVEPSSIGFIEAHGTGTRLGDLVEVEGLKQAFADRSPEDGTGHRPPIWLGAVKTAIGHLEAAAGIAGVIRTVLSLHHNYLSANRNMTEVNPQLRLEGSPFMLLNQSRPWSSHPEAVRRAGVSSFGFGGTNAHVVLESYTPPPAPASAAGGANGPFAVPVSALTPDLLRRYAAALRWWIEDRQPPLADIAFTLQQGRDGLPARAVLVAASLADLVEGLAALENGSCPVGTIRAVAGGGTLAGSWASAARVWLEGSGAGWPVAADGHRCSLPVPPLDRKRYWFRAPPPAPSPASPGAPPSSGAAVKIRLEPLRAPLVPGRTVPAGSGADTIPAHPSPAPVEPAPVEPVIEGRSPGGVEPRLAETLSNVLLMDGAEIDVDRPFGELGLDSILRMDFSRAVSELYGLALSGADLYEFDTLRKLSARIRAAVDTGAGDGMVGGDGPSPVLLCERVRELTGRCVGADDDFVTAGLTSFDMLKVIADLERLFGPLTKTLLFDQPTPNALCQWLGRGFGTDMLERLASHDAPRPSVPVLPDFQVLDDGAAVIRKSALAGHPEMHARVREMELRWAKEQGLPGRDIAPFLYIAAGDSGFLHFTERDGLLLSWNSCVGEESFERVVTAWTTWACRTGFRPNFLSMRLVSDLGGRHFCSTPFGAVQRIADLASFSLEGRKMARLRNKVAAFARSGSIGVAEYAIGSDPAVDRRIVEMIDQWGGRKDMVNPYVRRVRREILGGVMADAHRVFLTRVDDVIVAAIIITRIPSENGYLLDLEFFADEMPNGGLDYSIVRILEHLRDEGVRMFSFGATLGVHVCESPVAHPQVGRALAELQKTGLFKGNGNLQFKNKFRPETMPVYLCQPADASEADISSLLLLIADPLVETPAGDGEEPVSGAGADAGDAGVPGARELWHEELRRHGWNPLAIRPSAHNFNLCTDSWMERNDPFILDHIRTVSTDGVPLLDGGLRSDLLPFDYFHPTHSGKAAEGLILGWLPAGRKTVIHNGVFPSWMYSCLDQGCTPVPVKVDAETGRIDPDHLGALLKAHGSDVGLCCFELTPNALGGPALGLDNLREVVEIARSRSVPVIFDATRGLSGAWQLSRCLARPFRDVVRDLYALPTAVTVSLSKEFGLRSGGVVATSDPALKGFLTGRVRDRGHDVGLAERQAIAAALADTEWAERMVGQRARRVAELGMCLRQELAMPVAAAGLHAVLIDAAALCRGLSDPVASALAWLYRRTGVIAAPHLNAGVAFTRDCMRLTIPVGLPEPVFRALMASVRGGLAGAGPLAGLVKVPTNGDGPAHYVPRDDLPEDIAEDLATPRPAAPAEANWDVVRAWQPEARCRLVPYGRGVVEVFEAGAGPALVLLHPFNIGAGFFAPQLRDMAATHRVIVIHAPGAGRTTATDNMTFEGLCDMILHCVDALEVGRRFTLGGASFGGLTALSFAARHPERLNALVLFGSSYKVGNRKGEINRLSAVVDEDCRAVEAAGHQGELPNGELREILRQCETMDARTGLRYLEVFAQRPNLLEQARALRLPTLLVHGLHDTVIAIAIAGTLAEAIPGARLVTVGSAGHFPSLTCPGEVNRLVCGFIEEVSGAAAEGMPPMAEV